MKTYVIVAIEHGDQVIDPNQAAGNVSDALQERFGHTEFDYTTEFWPACVLCDQPKGTEHNPGCPNSYKNLHPSDPLPVMEDDCS